MVGNNRGGTSTIVFVFFAGYVTLQYFGRAPRVISSGLASREE
jgi:hypothetical protein